MPASDIGIDLGTRNSLAYSTGKGLVLNEPSIVVYDKNTEKIRAIGEEAPPVSGITVSDHPELIRAYAQVKQACARANGELIWLIWHQ